MQCLCVTFTARDVVARLNDDLVCAMQADSNNDPSRWEFFKISRRLSNFTQYPVCLVSRFNHCSAYCSSGSLCYIWVLLLRKSVICTDTLPGSFSKFTPASQLHVQIWFCTFKLNYHKTSTKALAMVEWLWLLLVRLQAHWSLASLKSTEFGHMKHPGPFRWAEGFDMFIPRYSRYPTDKKAQGHVKTLQA